MRKYVFLLAITVISCLSVVSSFESFYKFRIYKDLIEKIFSKNLKIILDHAEKSQNKDVSLYDLNTVMTNISIKVQPRNENWEDLQLELFFDEGQLVLEGHELEFAGSGLVVDPTTQAVEKIEFRAPLTTMQIVMTLGEDYAAWGSLYPRILFDEVVFNIDEQLITVSAFGELPLYKSHQFEKSVKKWLTAQLIKRQDDFKQSIQKAEKNMWQSFPFSSKVLGSDSLHINTSLSEPMKLHGDYLHASFINEFDHNIDYSDMEERLVPVKSSFSDANDYKKDVQFIFDENLVNNHFLGYFNVNKVISLTELVMGWIPDQYQGHAKVIQNFFTTMWFARPFPEVVQEHGLAKRVDLRCGFSKQFLQGKMQENHVSQVWFKEGNKFEFTFNFGCGIFIGPKIADNPMAFFQAILAADTNKDASDQEW